MKKYNVAWILVDSVRRYHCNEDDRGRLEVMDEFSEKSVELLNTITSAPTTTMSISAMMTSLPSYYLSKHYNSIRTDPGAFLTLNDILKEAGYSCYSFCRHLETRENLKNIFDLVDRRYWPKKYKFNHYWSNEDINLIFNLLVKKKGLRKPAFLFFDYNCRLDPKISNRVKRIISQLDSAGLNEKNTIFILCSDHGYPDPLRGFSAEEFKRRNIGHDLHLTDDNLMVPMILKYPGGPKNKKIKSTVSTLDIMPTILEIIGLNSFNFKGRSLLNLIEGREKDLDKEIMVRSDVRFMAQKGRATAIRGNRYKYIFHHDTKEEEFYDIKKDVWEKENVINRKDLNLEINKFKDEFKKDEQEAIKFQFKCSLKKVKKKFESLVNIHRRIRVLIISFKSSENVRLLEESLNESFNNPIIKKYSLRNSNKRYDLAILIFDNQKKDEHKSLMKIAKKINKRRLIEIDSNLNFHNKKGVWFVHLKKISSKRREYIKDPSLIIFDLSKYLKAIFIKMCKKFGFFQEKWDFKNEV